MGEITVAAGQAGKSCPYCRFPLKQGSQAIECDRCGAIHHSDCWSEGSGCAVVGCFSDQQTVSADQPPSVDRSRIVIPMSDPSGALRPAQPVSASSEPREAGNGAARAVLIGLGCGLGIVLLGLGALFLSQGSSSNDSSPTPPVAVQPNDPDNAQSEINALNRQIADNRRAAVTMSRLLEKSTQGRDLSASSPGLAIANRREILNSLSGLDGALGSVEQARFAFMAAMRESIMANQDRMGGATSSVHDLNATAEKENLTRIWNSGVARRFGLSPIGSLSDI